MTNQLNTEVFTESTRRPMEGKTLLYISKTGWQASGADGMALTPEDGTTTIPDMYFSFVNESGEDDYISDKYKIASIRKPNNVYIVQ